MFDADNDSKLLRMYGPIGSYFDDGISDVDIVKALDGMAGQDIEIVMKSDGGDVFEGISIYNQLKRYPGKVKITVDSIAASIASVIAMSADELILESEHSMLMIHNPWTAAIGDAKEFRSVADLLDKIGGEIASIYAKKSKKDKDHYLAMMKEDKYFTAAEALEEGLIDGIAGQQEPEQEQVHEEVVFAAAKYDQMDAADKKNAKVAIAASFAKRRDAQDRLNRTKIS